MTSYDALLVVSFGGPEQMDDVMPFLENVLRGKNVPHERMLEVAEHYKMFDGVSPINDQNRALIAALEAELADNDINLPIYWGNRNWHPLLPDTFQQMHTDGIRRVLAFFTSAYGSYSGCRQYQEDIARALSETGLANEIQVDRLRFFFNHPRFIEANAEHLRQAIANLPEPDGAFVAFTAHSIPQIMADTSPYVEQLTESARLIAEAAGVEHHALVYQSRSGPPHQPWLEPDICDYMEETLYEDGITNLVIMPIGFLSDHLEVVYDLDTEADQLAQKLGIDMIRAATVGTHPHYVQMIRELIQERIGDTADRLAVGTLPAHHDVCPADCCKMPMSHG